jgi:eukaryotic-like serine/threonine-protein kinase
VTHPDRWQHAERVFHAALARNDRERAAFLRDSCGDDEALRREVESLLAIAGDAQAFMQQSALDVAAAQIQAGTPRPLAGTRLGQYEIGALLGSGGMGDVFRARDSKLGRDVAIKILPQIFTVDTDRRARFEREARLLASLNHPNIAAIYEFEQYDGIHALVLELVQGETLSKRLHAGALPIRDVLSLARQIAEALDAAHDKGIVHRDLKPSNIMITPDGVAKVLDFGLARSGAEEPSQAMTDETRDGVILGTVAYMSPEQARGKRADKRSDIWAFGCVVWAMLTGRAPFSGETVSDTIAAILDHEPAWDTLPGSTPTRLRHLLQRCLEKDPKRRLRDIGDAELDVEEVAPPGSTRVPGWREASAWIAAAASLVGALAVGAYAVSRPAAMRPVRFNVVSPEDGAIREVALSGDGRRLAFVDFGPNRYRRIWVRAVDALEPAPLEGTEGANKPFWSPDGRFIAFFAQGKLKKISSEGGAPQVLCDAADAWGGTWNDAGTILFAPALDTALFQVSANGGKPVPVTTRLEGETGHRYPQFLPDGRHFLFLVPTGRGTRGGIYEGSLDSPQTVLLVESLVRGQYAAPGYLLFVRGNALMAQTFDPDAMRLSGDVVSIAEGVWNDSGGGDADFSVTAGVLAYREREKSAGELLWVDRAGRGLANTGPPANYIHPWLSPDERRAVVEIADPDTQAHAVWMLDLLRGSRSRFIDGPAQSHFPVWSPDGRTVLFDSDRGGPWTLLAKPSTGEGAEEELLKPTANSLALDWSRDGHFILYQTQGLSTRFDIWALPIAPRGKPFAVADTPRNERQAQLSPDGRWVAYTSDANGRDEVWVQAFPHAHDTWMVSTMGGSQPQWRRDGRELFYISSDRKLTAVEVKPAGSAFDTSAPTSLFTLKLADSLAARNNYMPSADGRRFLINTSYSGLGTRVGVVLDWVSAMRQR